MNKATASKLQDMMNDKAVILTDKDVDAIEKAGHEVRTAFNTKRIDTLDMYVGWMSEEAKPANIRLDNNHYAFASIA